MGVIDLESLSDDEFQEILAGALQTQRQDRKESQISYYVPVSETAVRVHCALQKIIGVGGGNRASKTDTMLAELTMLATGVWPSEMPNAMKMALMRKFRGPVTVRVVCQSIKNTLYPIILPKLQWWKWQGRDEAGGIRGHWGWIPKRCLVGGSWKAAWSERLLTLRTTCEDPREPGRILGESQWQFMSYDQDPGDFASGDCHHVLHDEVPKFAIWRENAARTMGVGGRMMLAMTWPDDPAIPVDWIYDQIYEPSAHSADIAWFEMWTEDNRNLDPEDIRRQERMWNPEIREVRLKGRPIRFSHRVHPLFTVEPREWCEKCHREAKGKCRKEHPGEVREFTHVMEFDSDERLPCLWLLDPHPRKPHYCMWIQVDTWSDLRVVAEELIEGGPEEVAKRVEEVEGELGLNVVRRIGDPNMLRSPSGVVRGVTWQDEFARAGLRVDLADDSDVGRGRVNAYLEPDDRTGRPRLIVHPRCTVTIRQMQRFVWDDWRQSAERDQKQKVKNKDDDMPALLRYALNSAPSWETLCGGYGVVVRTRSGR